MEQLAQNNFNKISDQYFGFLESIEKNGENSRIIFDALPAQYFLKENNDLKSNWADIPIVSLHLLLKQEEIDSFPGMGGRSFSTDRWYLIEMSKGGFRSEVYAEIDTKHEEERYISHVLYLRKNEGTARQLYDKFSLDQFDGTEANEEIIQGIMELKGEKISFIAVYKVGQGNCNALCNSECEPLAYFDFGCGCYHNSNPTNKLNYCFEKKPPIVLSHWHADHWTAVRYSNEAFTVPWIVPKQTIGASAWRHAARLHSNHNLYIWPANRENPKKPIGPIFKCLGRHKNHSGLSLIAEIVGKKTSEYYLLPGDSAFRYIPRDDRPLHGFVAPHHGGYYQFDSIPKPSNGNGQIIYSYGTSNSYRHPDPRAVKRYDSRGWSVKRCTVNGHCVMGWRGNHVSLGMKSIRKCGFLIKQIVIV